MIIDTLVLAAIKVGYSTCWGLSTWLHISHLASIHSYETPHSAVLTVSTTRITVFGDDTVPLLHLLCVFLKLELRMFTKFCWKNLTSWTRGWLSSPNWCSRCYRLWTAGGIIPCCQFKIILPFCSHSVRIGTSMIPRHINPALETS